MPEPATQHAQYPLLDGLRFVAALLVVAFHFVGNDTRDVFWERFLPHGAVVAPYYSHVNEFWFLGYVGVQVFFSISGYIISVSAVGSSSGLDFFEKRLLRILPALWICTAVAAFFFLYFHILPLTQVAIMSLRSALVLPIGPYIDGVVWTIIIEMVFYVLVCAYISCADKRRIVHLGYGMIACSTAYWMAITAFPALATPAVTQLAPRLLLEHGAFFGIGIVLSMLGRSGSRGWNWFFLTLGLVPAFLQIDAASLRIYQDFGTHGATASPWPAFLIWLAAIGILYLSTRTANSGWLSGHRDLLRRIGLMTYPLYLIHFTTGAFLYAEMEEYFELPPYLASVLDVAAVIVLAWLIAQYAEVFLRRALKRPFDLLFLQFRTLAYPSAKRRTPA